MVLMLNLHISIRLLRISNKDLFYTKDEERQETTEYTQVRVSHKLFKLPIQFLEFKVFVVVAVKYPKNYWFFKGEEEKESGFVTGNDFSSML